MRAGRSGYTVQQPLTFESTSLVKQAIALARRRGHGQVTPLHVATTMLSASNGIFRTACLQSHSHPLQCKALELCFNVELNRLPVSSSSPMRPSVAPQSQHPTISNALVAAFKRAQANKKRSGSMENQQQQQPLLVVNIELEQLIISILDDPSVSRVMREAGFLSTQVKSNIEHEQVQGVFLDQTSNSPTNLFKEHNLLDTTKTLVSDYAKEEDVASVLEGLIKKKTNIVVVGECLVTLEKIVKDVKDKFEKGDIPEELKEVKFISIPFSFVNHIDNHEIKEKLDVLGRLVKDVYAKRVVLYVGDFNQWMIHYKSNSIVEHVIKVLGKMVCEFNRENGKCWLLGISTFATYTRCTNSNHLLENRWGLHPITLPSGSLGLSLSTEREARILSRSVCNSNSTLSCLPSWLKDECTRLEHNHQVDECKKQNSVRGLIPKESPEKSSNFSSTIAYDSIYSYDQQLPYSPSPHSHGNLQFHLSPSTNDNMNATTLNMQEPNLKFSCFSNTSLNSGGSSSEIADIDYYIPRFKQFNSENLQIMCNALEQKFPWQKHIVPEICTTILQCRSGMLRRKDTNAPNDIRDNTKEETWLLFYGPDSQAKEIFARELSKVVFGSYSNFISISLRSFSSIRAYSDDEGKGFRNKRRRDEQGFSHIEKIAHAISENPHRVIFVEDLMEGDMCSQFQIKRAIERGKIGEEVSLGDAIIIFSCESFNNTSMIESRKKIQLVNLDLNISFDDEHGFENKSEGEMGIVESVDGFIVFRQHELYEDLRL